MVCVEQERRIQSLEQQLVAHEAAHGKQKAALPSTEQPPRRTGADGGDAPPPQLRSDEPDAHDQRLLAQLESRWEAEVLRLRRENRRLMSMVGREG